MALEQANGAMKAPCAACEHIQRPISECGGGCVVVDVWWWWMCGGGCVVVVDVWWMCGGGCVVVVDVWWMCGGGCVVVDVWEERGGMYGLVTRTSPARLSWA